MMWSHIKQIGFRALNSSKSMSHMLHTHTLIYIYMYIRGVPAFQKYNFGNYIIILSVVFYAHTTIFYTLPLSFITF